MNTPHHSGDHHGDHPAPETDHTHHPDHASHEHHADADTHGQAMHHGHPHSALDEDHQVHGHGEHAGHSTAMFRERFWWSLILSIPVVIFSPMVAHLLGYPLPEFPGSADSRDGCNTCYALSSSSSRCLGVSQFSVLRGRSLSWSAMASRSASVRSDRSVPLGMY